MRFAGVLLAGGLALLTPVMAAAQEQAPDNEIVVEGERKAQEAAVRALAKEVTGHLKVGRPLPRFFEPMCLAVGGINPEFAGAFAQRITDNARRADVPIAEGKCQPNALVVFAKDGRKQLEKVRKQHKWIFTGLGESRIKDILASRDPAFAWQLTEIRGVDGRRFDTEGGGGLPLNRQYQTGRLNQPIRSDVVGAVVVFDSSAIEGISAVQLADYASVRLLAPTQEIDSVNEEGMSTIMSLFLTPDTAPDEMTEFDLAYLRGVYQLKPNSPGTAVYGAAARSYRRDPVD
jgi:hypothetical protein